jgi:MoaA/NifB/PqqE/SkfB family radical SAM enzyme
VKRRRLELQLDLTSRCNLRCIMCYFSTVRRLRFKPFDHDDGPRGNLALPVLRHVARELFPSSRSVGLGCAAEPLLHPHFVDALQLARRYRVPTTWVQTNLLGLDRRTAGALVANRVQAVAVSIDGTDRARYEAIRRGASWDRLERVLSFLRDAKKAAGTTLPRLRITFVWMRSNRDQLSRLPAFAAALGASELDVRFVAPTVGVDTTGELLTGEPQESLAAELWSVARDASRRGLRLHSFPSLGREPDADRSVLGRVRRRLWLLRSGLDGPSRWCQSLRERTGGCVHPGRTLVIRPNGAVLPCPFWEDEPVALVPRDHRAAILHGAALSALRQGLRSGHPHPSCRSCSQRADALFRPCRPPVRHPA